MPQQVPSPLPSQKKVNRSQWAAPTFGIPKKDGSVRFISDFRDLNKRIKRRPHPIPHIQDLLMNLEGFQCATSLDLNKGCYHLELSEKSKQLCTIVLPFSKFEYQRTPMGWCKELVRGFLQHVAETYKSMKPYLLGFHMTIDGWRPNTDEDGNKIPRSKLSHPVARDPDLGCLFMAAEVGGVHAAAPSRVKAVPRFRSDVNALRLLTEAEDPPLRRVRCRRASVVVDSFGDASGPGFGSTVVQTNRNDVEFEYGQWITTVRQEKSSNWRELTKCVFGDFGRQGGAGPPAGDGDIFLHRQ